MGFKMLILLGFFTVRGASLSTVISTGALCNLRIAQRQECRETRGVSRDSGGCGARNALSGARQFRPLISRARKISAAAKTTEKLAVRMGRCCLFSVICIEF
jgi:hypothetical protein